MTLHEYHPQVAEIPFALGRHGQSDGNAGDLAQGRGEDLPGRPNGLTPQGRADVEGAVPAFAAAGLDVHHVGSSELSRAKESATTFVDASDHPKPTLLPPVPGLKEVSQHGWEGRFRRDEVKALRKAAVADMRQRLLVAGLDEGLVDFVPWITSFGEGETPLGAGLRGIKAVEDWGPGPRHLLFTHAMLNRYIDGTATSVPVAEREKIARLLTDGSLAGSIAVLESLRANGVPNFKIADDARNRQANGGATEYTVDPKTGLWVAGRRIEPPTAADTYPFIEHRRSPEGLWVRQTPGPGAPAE